MAGQGKTVIFLLCCQILESELDGTAPWMSTKDWCGHLGIPWWRVDLVNEDIFGEGLGDSLEVSPRRRTNIVSMVRLLYPSATGTTRPTGREDADWFRRLWSAPRCWVGTRKWWRSSSRLLSCLLCRFDCGR